MKYDKKLKIYEKHIKILTIAAYNIYGWKNAPGKGSINSKSALVALAKDRGIHVPALTDRDTTDDAAEMIAAGEKIGVCVIVIAQFCRCVSITPPRCPISSIEKIGHLEDIQSFHAV